MIGGRGHKHAKPKPRQPQRVNADPSKTQVLFAGTVPRRDLRQRRLHPSKAVEIDRMGESLALLRYSRAPRT